VISFSHDIIVLWIDFLNVVLHVICDTYNFTVTSFLVYLLFCSFTCVLNKVDH